MKTECGWRARRNCRRRGRLHGRSDAAILLQGLDIPDEAHERKMGELQGRTEGPGAAGAGAVRTPAALLLDEPRTTSTWIRSLVHGLY